MIDLVAAGMADHERRAWLAAARGAPVPPLPTPAQVAAICARHAPAPRRVRVSVAELDDAIAAALKRGHSSLEERMARTVVATAPPRTAKPAPCVVCGRPSAPPPDAPICARCAADPPAARAQLQARRDATERALVAAVSAAQASVDALSPDDARRWAQIVAWRQTLAAARMWRADAENAIAAEKLVLRADAIAAAQARLARVAAAIDGKSAQVSPALRQCWHADEVAYWSSLGADGLLRRLEVASDCLEGVVAALEAFDTPAGMVRVASAKNPGVSYLVARDGSSCTCPGFAARKTCKHTIAQKEHDHA